MMRSRKPLLTYFHLICDIVARTKKGSPQTDRHFVITGLVETEATDGQQVEGNVNGLRLLGKIAKPISKANTVRDEVIANPNSEAKNMGQFAEAQFAEFGNKSLPCPICRKKIGKMSLGFGKLGFGTLGFGKLGIYRSQYNC